MLSKSVRSDFRQPTPVDHTLGRLREHFFPVFLVSNLTILPLIFGLDSQRPTFIDIHLPDLHG